GAEEGRAVAGLSAHRSAAVRHEARGEPDGYLPGVPRIVPQGNGQELRSARRRTTMKKPISTGCDWNFELLQEYDEAIADIAINEYKLDVFPNQIEVISSEQMLDAYASTGMPIGYHHWSFGKEYLRHEQAYRKGMRGLAYELVINSNPCIAYLMEDNTMTLQALVIAHACYGHNSFFKGNYLFRQWTSPDAIVDYLVFAKNFIMQCEERHGVEAVESLLDA